MNNYPALRFVLKLRWFCIIATLLLAARVVIFTVTGKDNMGANDYGAVIFMALVSVAITRAMRPPLRRAHREIAAAEAAKRKARRAANES